MPWKPLAQHTAWEMMVMNTKIITQVFLYKFLNDKFGYALKTSKSPYAAKIREAEKWEVAYSQLTDMERMMLWASIVARPASSKTWTSDSKPVESASQGRLRLHLRQHNEWHCRAEPRHILYTNHTEHKDSALLSQLHSTSRMWHSVRLSLVLW